MPRLWMGAIGAAVMDLVRHWAWVLSQTEVLPSSTDRLVWVLTGACAFLVLVTLVLFLALRAGAWRR